MNHEPAFRTLLLATLFGCTVTLSAAEPPAVMPPSSIPPSSTAPAATLPSATTPSATPPSETKPSATKPQERVDLTVLVRGGKEVSHRDILPPRAFIGFSGLAITPELRLFFGAPREEGVLVQELMPGGPAEAAGIRVGDVVTAMDGYPITSGLDLGDLLRTHRAGQVVQMEVIRNRVLFFVPVELRVLPIELRTVVYPDGPPVMLPPSPPPSPTTKLQELKEIQRRLQELEKP